MHEDAWSIPKGGYMLWHRSDGWSEGTFIGRSGMVSVYSQGGQLTPHTRLDVVCNGRCRIRCFDREYSRRHLHTLARRFSEEIAGAV